MIFIMSSLWSGAGDRLRRAGTLLLVTGVVGIGLVAEDAPEEDGARRPFLEWATLAGTPDREWMNELVMDSQGNFVAVGATQKVGLGPAPAESDVLVVKWSADGKVLFQKVIGGDGPDYAIATAVDEEDFIYVAGHTASTDFPNSNALFPDYAGGTAFGAGDGFVLKLSPDGEDLIWSTYIGGSADDDVEAMAINSRGELVVAGFSLSTDMPTRAPLQANLAGQMDMWVARLTLDGRDMPFLSYYGGSDYEYVTALEIASDGSILLGGETYSLDFPVVNALQPELSPLDENLAEDAFFLMRLDAYVVKLSPEGDKVLFSTYLGRGGEEFIDDIALDRGDNIYLCGQIRSYDFTTPGAAQYEPGGGGSDCYVLKLRGDGSEVVFATYLGGAGQEQATNLEVTPDGRIIVVGSTSSLDEFPLEGAFQAEYGGGEWDAFLVGLSADGSRWNYGTYLGGKGADVPWGLVRVDEDTLYVSGITDSADFPVTDYNGPLPSEAAPPYREGFLARIGLALPQSEIDPPTPEPPETKFNPFRIERAGNSTFVIWPAGGSQILQSSTTLGPGADWQNVTEPPIKIGNEETILLDPKKSSESTRFFRLSP